MPCYSNVLNNDEIYCYVEQKSVIKDTVRCSSLKLTKHVKQLKSLTSRRNETLYFDILCTSLYSVISRGNIMLHMNLSYNKKRNTSLFVVEPQLSIHFYISDQNPVRESNDLQQATAHGTYHIWLYNSKSQSRKVS